MLREALSEVMLSKTATSDDDQIPSGDAILDIGATQGLQYLEVDTPVSTPAGVGGAAKFKVTRVVISPGAGGHLGVFSVHSTGGGFASPSQCRIPGLFGDYRGSFPKNTAIFRKVAGRGDSPPAIGLGASRHVSVPVVKGPSFSCSQGADEDNLQDTSAYMKVSTSRVRTGRRGPSRILTFIMSPIMNSL